MLLNISSYSSKFSVKVLHLITNHSTQWKVVCLSYYWVDVTHPPRWVIYRSQCFMNLWQKRSSINQSSIIINNYSCNVYLAYSLLICNIIQFGVVFKGSSPFFQLFCTRKGCLLFFFFLFFFISKLQKSIYLSLSIYFISDKAIMIIDINSLCSISAW